MSDERLKRWVLSSIATPIITTLLDMGIRPSVLGSLMAQ
jgi:hypothetical protein